MFTSDNCFGLVDRPEGAGGNIIVYYGLYQLLVCRRGGKREAGKSGVPGEQCAPHREIYISDVTTVVINKLAALRHMEEGNQTS